MTSFLSGILHNGRFYSRGYAPGEFVLRTFSISDGTKGTLFRQDIKDRAVGGVCSTDTDILAVIAPGHPPPNIMMGMSPQQDVGSVAVDGKRIHIGTYQLAMTPPRPLGPGETRITIPREMPHDMGPTRLYRIPLDGGTVQETTLDAPNYAVLQAPHILTKQGLFWIMPRTSKRTIIVARNTYGISASEEVSLTDDLMFSPADGGKARLWWHGVHSRMTLKAAGDGLYLPDMKTRRLSLIDPKALPVTMPAADADFRLEFAGRVYWEESFSLRDNEEEPPGRQPPSSGRVVSSQMDGTDRRVIWDGRDARGVPQSPGLLFVHQGRLYIVYSPSRPSEQDTPPPGNRAQVPPSPPVDSGWKVARLYPDKPGVLGAPCALPSGMTRFYSDGVEILGESFHADGGYLYIPRREKQPRSRLDFLYAQNTERYITALYRVRLPD